MNNEIRKNKYRLNRIKKAKEIRKNKSIINKKVNILIDKIESSLFNEIIYNLENTEYLVLAKLSINNLKRRFNGPFRYIWNCELFDLDIGDIYNTFIEEFNIFIRDFCIIYNFDLDVRHTQNEIIYDILYKEN